jgi:hypothetical protein
MSYDYNDLKKLDIPKFFENVCLKQYSSLQELIERSKNKAFPTFVDKIFSLFEENKYKDLIENIPEEFLNQTGKILGHKKSEEVKIEEFLNAVPSQIENYNTFIGELEEGKETIFKEVYREMLNNKYPYLPDAMVLYDEDRRSRYISNDEWYYMTELDEEIEKEVKNIVKSINRTGRSDKSCKGVASRELINKFNDFFRERGVGELLEKTEPLISEGFYNGKGEPYNLGRDGDDCYKESRDTGKYHFLVNPNPSIKLLSDNFKHLNVLYSKFLNKSFKETIKKPLKFINQVMSLNDENQKSCIRGLIQMVNTDMNLFSTTNNPLFKELLIERIQAYNQYVNSNLENESFRNIFQGIGIFCQKFIATYINFVEQGSKNNMIIGTLEEMTSSLMNIEQYTHQTCEKIDELKKITSDGISNLGKELQQVDFSISNGFRDIREELGGISKGIDSLYGKLDQIETRLEKYDQNSSLQ